MPEPEKEFNFEQLQLEEPTIKLKPKPMSLMKRFTRGIFAKFIMSIAISMVGGFILHSATLFSVLTSICAAVGVLGGEDARNLKEKISDLLHRAKDSAPPGEEDATSEAEADHKPTIRERLVDKVKGKVAGAVKGKAAEAIREKAEEAKEVAEEKVEEVKEKAVEVKEEVKEAVTGAADRIAGAGRAVGGRIAGGASSARDRMAEAAEELRRQQASQPSARCPFCRSPMKIPGHSNGTFLCRTCRASVPAGMARAAAARGRR